MMNRPSVDLLALVTVVAVLAPLGCDQATDTSTPPPVAAPTAAERFESLVSALKRQVEDITLSDATIASSYDAPPGTPVTSGRVRVESQLEPATEGEPRRAVISLITDSKVTIILPSQGGGDTQEQGPGTDEALVAELEGVSGLPDLNTLRGPSGTTASSGGGSIREIKPDDSRSDYELEYRDGKWITLTELDPINEPFYASAIEYALKKQ